MIKINFISSGNVFYVAIIFEGFVNRIYHYNKNYLYIYLCKIFWRVFHLSNILKKTQKYKIQNNMKIYILLKLLFIIFILISNILINNK